MKKYIFLFVIISAIILSFETVSYGFSLNISPPSIHVSIKPGESASGNIVVDNRGESSLGILVYVQDWVYNPDGSKTFMAAGTAPLSCAKDIRVFPKTFKLEAGEKTSVQYTVTVPEDAKGGYYAVIFFESIPAEEVNKTEGMMVRFAGRLGSIIYVETEGKSIKSGVVKSFNVTPPHSDKPLEASLSFENIGNVYIGAEGTLNITDKDGNVFGKQTFGPVNTLPGDTREAKVEWLGELEAGTYYAVVTLDIGTDEPVVKESEIVISSGGSIQTMSVDASTNKPSFSVVVKNSGQLNIDVGGKIDVFKEDGALVKSVNLNSTLIAPDKERELKAVFDENLPVGSYKAKAVILIGGKEIAKEEIFSIK